MLWHRNVFTRCVGVFSVVMKNKISFFLQNIQVFLCVCALHTAAFAQPSSQTSGSRLPSDSTKSGTFAPSEASEPAKDSLKYVQDGHSFTKTADNPDTSTQGQAGNASQTPRDLTAAVSSFLNPSPQPEQSARKLTDSTTDTTTSTLQLIDTLRTFFYSFRPHPWPNPTLDSVSLFTKDAISLKDLAFIGNGIYAMPYFLSNRKNFLVNPLHLPLPIIDTLMLPLSQSISFAFDSLHHHVSNTPKASLAPHTQVQWENGLFNGTDFAVSFSRPISQTIGFRLSSHFTRFDAEPFNHNAGDVYNLFANAVEDTASIVNNGYNPFLQHHLAKISLDYNPSAHTSSFLSYGYSDFRDERFSHETQEYVDAKRFIHDFNFDLRHIFSENRFTPQVSVPTTIQSLVARNQRWKSRASRIKVSSSPGMLAALHKNFSLGGAVPVSLYQSSLNDRSKWVIWHARPQLRMRLSPLKKDQANWTIKLDAGMAAIRQNAQLSYAPISTFDSKIQLHSFGFALRVQRNAHLFLPPLDTALIVTSKAIDEWNHASAQISYSTNGFSTALRYDRASSLDTATVHGMWELVSPVFFPATQSLSLSQSVTLGAGFDLLASATYANSQPHFTTSSQLQWSKLLIDNEYSIGAHLQFKTVSAFSSDIDSAQSIHWTYYQFPPREVALKFWSQIRSFRIFLKVDNALNRKYHYIPGYPSPGITFRWGLHWFIPR